MGCAASSQADISQMQDERGNVLLPPGIEGCLGGVGRDGIDPLGMKGVVVSIISSVVARRCPDSNHHTCHECGMTCSSQFTILIRIEDFEALIPARKPSRHIIYGC